MGVGQKEARLLMGQVFAVRLGSEPDRLDLERFPVANYIVFRDALATSFMETRGHLNEVKRKLREHTIEPLLMMDEEGGRVTQISGFFPSAPSAGAVSRHLEPAEARMLYGHMSEALAGIGIDINLAPCMDVNTEPMNPIIGRRAFGEERPGVEVYGNAFIEASRRHLACVAKHFPGHGMTTIDSHLDMPVVPISKNDLKTIHIPPFASALRAGAEGVMIGHCSYPALQDEPVPASLSREVVHDLLRRDLDFDGLVITDSLDMEAVTMGRDAAETARAALDAGVDMLLYTDVSTRFEEAFENLTADLLSGRLEWDRLRGAASRRQAVLKRTASLGPPGQSISRDHYLKLRDRVLRASVRTDDPEGLLPLRSADIAYIATRSGPGEGMRSYAGTLKEVGSTEEARGKVLLVWLVEPLRLEHSLAQISRMIEASRVSVLVTSYPVLADMLSDCAAKIVTYDTSPETQTAILRRLFG